MGYEKLRMTREMFYILCHTWLQNETKIAVYDFMGKTYEITVI